MRKTKTLNVLIPVLSILLAFVVGMLIILALGKNPIEAIGFLMKGAFGSKTNLANTVVRAMPLIFTGLCTCFAYRCGVFNLGGEGQFLTGAMAAITVTLLIGHDGWWVTILAVLAGTIAGGIWGLLPGLLKTWRGLNEMITTIMFNYVAAALIVYLLVNVLRPTGQMDPATARFPAGTTLPTLTDIPGLNLIFTKKAPANVTLFIALLSCWGVWLLLWRTRLGFQIRAYGKSEPAAIYAGISPARIIIVAMLISGALAGMMSINNVMGESGRLVQNSSEGAGFIGIAVALMGRNHPVGVFLAALLFGFLYQGGAELGLWTSIPIELRIVVQGLVILFTGALDNMVRMMLGWAFRARRQQGVA